MRSGVCQTLLEIEPAEFAREYWGRRTLHRGGSRSKLVELGLELDFTGLLQIARKPIAGERNLKAQYFNGDGVHREFRIQPEQIPDLMAGGMTVCLADLATGHAPFARVAADLRRELGWLGRMMVNAYASPPSAGFGLHFDFQAVLTVQLAGEKTWRFSESPATEAPPENFVAGYSVLDEYRSAHPYARFDIPDEKNLQVATLRPGDVLFMPAGVWHRTVASKESLSIAITFLPYSMLDHTLEALRKRLVARTAWRRPAPFCPAGDRGPAVRELDVLGHELVSLLGDPSLLAAAPDASDSAAEEFELLPDERLRWTGPVLIEEAEPDDDGEPNISLRAAGGEVLISASARPLLETLIAHGDFAAGESLEHAGADVTWEVARALLGGLIARGLLTRNAPSKSPL